VQREAQLLGFEPALRAELMWFGEELWVHVRKVGRDADGRLEERTLSVVG
jgi:hypothetical protein